LERISEAVRNMTTVNNIGRGKENIVRYKSAQQKCEIDRGLSAIINKSLNYALERETGQYLVLERKKKKQKKEVEEDKSILVEVRTCVDVVVL